MTSIIRQTLIDIWQNFRKTEKNEYARVIEG